MDEPELRAKVERTGRWQWYVVVSWPMFPPPNEWMRAEESVVILLGTRRMAERKARRMLRRRARLNRYKSEATVIA